MSLPLRLDWQTAQDRWATILNPIISNPSATPNSLSNIVLKTGTNTINHGLDKKLTGWSLSRIRAASVIYDQQDTNQMPQLTLILHSSADVVVDLQVW